MTELIVKVQKKALLEQQQMELLQEQKQREKEVFDLRIAAHNEQVDVEAMEGFSVKGLLLKMTGKGWRLSAGRPALPRRNMNWPLPGWSVSRRSWHKSTGSCRSLRAARMPFPPP